MAIVIHLIKGKRYAYDHYRIGSRIHTKYLYPCNAKGKRIEAEHGGGRENKGKVPPKAEKKPRAPKVKKAPEPKHTNDLNTNMNNIHIGDIMNSISKEMKANVETLAKQVYGGYYVTKENVTERGTPLRWGTYMKNGRFVTGLSMKSYEANKTAIDEIMGLVKAEMQARVMKESWVVKALSGDIITQLSEGEDFSLYGLTAELPKDVWNKIKQYTEYIRGDDAGTDIDMYDDFKGGWTVSPKAAEILKSIAEKIVTPDEKEIVKKVMAEKEIATKLRTEAKIHTEQVRKELAEVEIAFNGADYLEGRFNPAGVRIDDPFYPVDIYGGGRWFVIEKDYIWFVKNNGHDGDDWSRNNIETGGAGAVGVRIPYTEELAEKIKRLVK